MTEPGFIGSFLEQAATAPERVALDFDSGQAVSYGALQARIEQFCYWLAQQGPIEGERIVVALPNGLDLVASVYAIASLGGIFVPISPKLTDHELSPILSDAMPVGALLHTSRSMVANHPSLKFLLTTTPGDEEPPSHVRLVPASHVAELPRRALQEPAGNPKVSCHFTYKGVGYPLGCVHRYHDYTAAIRACVEEFLLEPGAINLQLLPMTPVYGMVTWMGTLTGGGRLRIATRRPGAHLAQTLVERKVAATCVVPDLLRHLLPAARRLGANFTHRLHPRFQLLTGASALPSALAAEAEEVFGHAPLEGYGLTECLPVCANRGGQNRAGSVGRPLHAGIDIRIVGATGASVAAGQVGEVTVGGPCVMDSYWNRPEETARFKRGDLFFTGDLGYLDSAGYLYLVGPRLPFTKIAGQMVDLVEVEEVALRHPHIERVRVLASPNGPLEAHIALEANRTVTSSDVIRFCSRLLPPHKVPRRIIVSQRRKDSVTMPKLEVSSKHEPAVGSARP